ncbi:MAG TPA: P1 family peptidase [Chloroflexota bacterium]
MVSGITDVPGLLVGHDTNLEAATGCTVVLCEEGAVGGVDVRGAAPGTRETDVLRPGHLVSQVHAVLLTGGSAFGLDAAAGVMRYLEERGRGFLVGHVRVPIVPAAVIFDLLVGDATVRPDAAAGYRACQAASRGPIAEGTVGAGTGATVGKLFGPTGATKGGLGTASLRLPDGLVVGAIVVVNAVGDVVDPQTGRIVAGARRPEGGFLDAMAQLRLGWLPGPGAAANTTIGVVATNARLDVAQCRRVASMAHDGLARTIRPVHTMHDGDTLFALATGHWQGNADVTRVGALAAEAVAEAVLRAVRLATGLHGIPAAREIATAE